MKNLFLLTLALISLKATAQLEMNLGNHIDKEMTINAETDNVLIVRSLLPLARDKKEYSIFINMQEREIPPFDNNLLPAGPPCGNASDALRELISDIEKEKDEVSLFGKINGLEKMKGKLGQEMQECIKHCDVLTEKTISRNSLKFKLANNQTITVTVKRRFKIADKDTITTWVSVFKTPEKTPWLVHYGLIYTPSALNKVDRFYSQADTNVANKYTITKENENSNKPWENISATINFTYPFNRETKGFDSGFTAGFGISSGFDLSGHVGLSAIIGENVILSSGIAMMQKYRLKGSYSKDQIIKENLNFESLHEKVWLPEIFFTLGFRFGSNPFAKKETPKPAEEGAK